jgi:hypothetical protein
MLILRLKSVPAELLVKFIREKDCHALHGSSIT